MCSTFPAVVRQPLGLVHIMCFGLDLTQRSAELSEAGDGREIATADDVEQSGQDGYVVDGSCISGTSPGFTRRGHCIALLG